MEITSSCTAPVKHAVLRRSDLTAFLEESVLVVDADNLEGGVAAVNPHDETFLVAFPISDVPKFFDTRKNSLGLPQREGPGRIS